MTNWKKLIYSGSNAELNELTASSIHLSGIGDVSASFAALSASLNPLTASAIDINTVSDDHDHSYYLPMSATASTGQILYAQDLLRWNPSSSKLTIQQNDGAKEASVEIRGTNQGSGRLFIGQSNTYGGGIIYQGDGVPDHIIGTPSNDWIGFYRRNNAVDSFVAGYKYNSDDFYFSGSVGIGTKSPSFSANAKGLDIAGTGGKFEAAQDGTERIPTLRITDTVTDYGSGFATVGEKRGAIEWYSSEGSHDMPGVSSAIYNINENTYNTQFGTAFYTFHAALEGDVDLGGDGLAERMRITHAGKVGIGTTTPNHKLDIGETELISNGTFDTNTDGWTAENEAILTLDSGLLKVTNDDTGVNSGGATQQITTVVGKTYQLSIYSNQAAGSLRIGTSSGASNIFIRTFDSKGVYITTFIATTTATWITMNNNIVTSGAIRRYDNISVKEVRAGSDNVGINLEGTNISYLHFKDPSTNATLNTYGDGTFRMGAEADSNTKQLVLKNGGNVGIGATNPGTLLEVRSPHVSGDVTGSVIGTYQMAIVGNGVDGIQLLTSHDTSEVRVVFGDSSSGDMGHIAYDNDADSMIFRTNRPDNSQYMVITSESFVGIGATVPSRQLHVKDTAETVAVRIEAPDGSQASVDLENSEGAFRIINDGGALDFYDDAGSAVSRMYIQSGSGNVGIGTTSPATTLEVDGNIKAISFTGSLEGTASYAITASYALTTDDKGLGFPYSGSDSLTNVPPQAVITGSLLIGGGLGGHITASGDISASGVGIFTGGLYSASVDEKDDVGIVVPVGRYIYTTDLGGKYLRRLIGKTAAGGSTDYIEIGQGGTELIDGIKLRPGVHGHTMFYNDATEVARIDHSGSFSGSGLNLTGNAAIGGDLGIGGTIFGLSGFGVTIDDIAVTSGSTNFGSGSNPATTAHIRTGSMSITGSTFTFNGENVLTDSDVYWYNTGTELTASNNVGISGSLQVLGDITASSLSIRPKNVTLINFEYSSSQADDEESFNFFPTLTFGGANAHIGRSDNLSSFGTPSNGIKFDTSNIVHLGNIGNDAKSSITIQDAEVTVPKIAYISPFHIFQHDVGTNIVSFTESRVYLYGDTHITGSLYVSESVIARSFTGSLEGTASYASTALTASYASTALTASYALNASEGDSVWYDGTTYISSSVDIQVSGAISASGKGFFGDDVGIGTNTPEAALHVKNTPSSTGTTNLLVLDGYLNTDLGVTGRSIAMEIRGGDGNSNASASIRLFNYDDVPAGGTDESSGKMIFAVTDAGTLTDRMTIDGDSGNVGIGTTSPGSKLHISGGHMRIDSSGATDNLYLEFHENGNQRFKIYENSNNVYFDGGPGNTHFRPRQNNLDNGNKSSGNFIVDGAALHIKHDTYEEFLNLDRTVDPEINEIVKITPSHLGQNTGKTTLNVIIGTGQFQFTEESRLGIGMTAPGYELDVNGTTHTKNMLLTEAADVPVAGTVALGQNTAEGLEIRTVEGYTRIGANNSSWSHFWTDLPKFWFEKEVVVNTGIVASYDEDLILRRDHDDTTYNQIKIGDDSLEIKLDDDARLNINGDGKLTLGSYGSNTHTGTEAYMLAVDSSGNVIETAINGGNAATLDSIDSTAFINNTHTSFYPGNDLTVGWYTIAVIANGRAHARFGIRDRDSGRHASVTFYATHHYGNGNQLTVLTNSKYSNEVFGKIRIKESGTYDGAALQVYISNAANSVTAFLLGDNYQTSGWTLLNWIPDATDPGVNTGDHSSAEWAEYTSAAEVDLSEFQQGMAVTPGPISGSFKGDGSNLTGVVASSGEATNADTVDYIHASAFLRSDVADTATGLITLSGGLKVSGDADDANTSQIIISGAAPQIKFKDTGHDNFYIHVNSNNFYVLADRDSNDAWESPYPLQLEADTDKAYTFGNRILTTADEGSGNGLDADTLDGNHASAFLTSIGADSIGDTQLVYNTGQNLTTASTPSFEGLIINHGDGDAITINVDAETDASILFVDDDDVGGQDFKITYNAESEKLRFHHSDKDPILTLTNAGKIGIGTDSPAKTFDVRFSRSDTSVSGDNLSGGGDGNGILIHNESATVGVYANLDFRARIADARIAVKDVSSKSDMHFLLDTNSTPLLTRMILQNDGDLHVASDIIAFSSTTSDRRLKTNIRALSSSLETVCKLEGVRYDWKHRPETNQLGVIAQQVEQHVPEVIHETKLPFYAPNEDDDTIYKTVRYEMLVPHLIEAIKELKAEVDELKSRLTDA